MMLHSKWPAPCLWRSVSALIWIILLLKTEASLSAADPSLNICLLSASAEYESDKSLSEFQAYLETRYHLKCHRAFGKDKGTDLPGLEALDGADLMIVFTRRITLSPPQLERIRKYISSERPIIGLRTASHGFQNYAEFDREILGGDYHGHCTNSQVEVQLPPGRVGHPVLAGVTPFSSRKLYKNPALANDTIVLLEGSTASRREPVAWVREPKGDRIFYTSLGTPEDFANESFRRLLVNAIFWATKRDETASRRPSNNR